MTPAETAKLVAVLIAAFPQARIAAGTPAAYESGLSDLDATAANQAVARLMRTSRFLPTIAEIREECLRVVAGPKRAGGDGWGDLRKAISRYGYMREPGVDFQFQDPIVAACVRAFGWRALCDSEDATSDRARFIALYDAHAATARQDAQARPILPAPPPGDRKQLNVDPGAAGELVEGLARRLAAVP